MSFFSYFRKFKKPITSLLILAVFLPSAYFAFPQKADAFWPTWDAIGDFFQAFNTPSQTASGVSNPVTAGATTAGTALSAAGHIKTFVLDPLAMMLAKIIIQDITASTVKWINSGFNGNPAFVQNPEQFFTNVGDQTASTYLSSTSNVFTNFVCSPFSAKIRLALVQSYLSNKTPNKCSIQSIVKNWTNFGSNFYDNGGWDGWFSMTQNSQNNPTGSFLQQQDALAIQIGNRQTHYQNQLTQGNGFLSWETCKTASQFQGPQPVAATPTDNTPSVDNPCDVDQSTGKCVTTEIDTSSIDTPTIDPAKCPLGTNVNTPGSVIEKQLANTLGSTVNQLGVAQSINQIVGALMTQMVKQVVGGFGTGGLSGLSQSSSGTASLQSQLVPTSAASTAQFQAQQNQITNTSQSTLSQSTTNVTSTINNAPSITLIGDNPLVWPLATTTPAQMPFVDPGFTAADATDGDITSKVVVTGLSSVDVTTAGTYPLVYNVTDSQGLSNNPVIRNVVVQ
jgi:hypothetical protein